MAAGQEESVRERARRVLQDNPDPSALEGQARGELASFRSSGQGDPARGQDGGAVAAYAREIERRMQAIHLVRELGPKRACYGDRVRELSRHLASLSGDSVHYRNVLERLREAHQEWLALEQKLWEAADVLRSTQWLVDLLADPSAESGAGEAAATREERA